MPTVVSSRETNDRREESPRPSVSLGALRFGTAGSRVSRGLGRGPTEVRFEFRRQLQDQLLTLVLKRVRQSKANHRLAKIPFAKSLFHGLDLAFIEDEHGVRPVHQILIELRFGEIHRARRTHLQVRPDAVQVFRREAAHLVLAADKQHSRFPGRFAHPARI